MTTTKEILIYSNLPHTKFRWVSYVTAVQLGLLLINFIALPTPKLMRDREKAIKDKVIKKKVSAENGEFIERYEPNPDFVPPESVMTSLKKFSWSELCSPKNVINNMIERPYSSSGVLASVGLIALALNLLARRTIHKITLLPGDKVRIATFSPFGFMPPKPLEISVRNISCIKSRSSDQRTLILKLRGFWLYHLVDKQDGKFHEPELYDEHFGYERAWAVKKD